MKKIILFLFTFYFCSAQSIAQNGQFTNMDITNYLQVDGESYFIDNVECNQSLEVFGRTTTGTIDIVSNGTVNNDFTIKRNLIAGASNIPTITPTNYFANSTFYSKGKSIIHGEAHVTEQFTVYATTSPQSLGNAPYDFSFKVGFTELYSRLPSYFSEKVRLYDRIIINDESNTEYPWYISNSPNSYLSNLSFYAHDNSILENADVINSFKVHAHNHPSGLQNFPEEQPAFSVSSQEIINDRKAVFNQTVSIGTPLTPASFSSYDLSNYKLFVNGGVLTKEIRVLEGWADYVFDEDYELITLHEVGEFINNNKMLPKSKSAKQIEEEGLNIGEATVYQQEKIEELFLYIIELNEEIELLKMDNQNLTELIKSSLK